MKIAVVGAGAIGCVTGALLSDTGHDVTLIGRDEQVTAINSSGLLIDWGSHGKLHEVSAKTSLNFAPDVLILAVKTQDVTEACRASAAYLKEAALVTMQNGVRSDEMAAAILGRDRIISAVVMFGATYLKPGEVVYNFPGGLTIGKAFPAAREGDNGCFEAAREALSSAFEIEISGDIHGTHWTKLILNLNNALSAALDLTLQEVFSDARMCRLGVMLMKEAYGVMEAAGIGLMPLSGLEPEKLKSLFDAPPEVGAQIYGKIMSGLSKEPLPGSVLQSIRRGRPTEVEYLNGEIVSLGRAHGVGALLNERLTRLVKGVEGTGRFMKTEELLKEMDA